MILRDAKSGGVAIRLVGADDIFSNRYSTFIIIARAFFGLQNGQMGKRIGKGKKAKVVLFRN